MAGFLAEHASEIAELTVEHLWLTGSAILFAAAIGVPTGIWLTRHPRWAKPVLGVVNVIQTIPSLALFGFLLPLPWIGVRAARIAIVALTAYALLPIVRNTYTGIHGVDPALIEVATALGMSSGQRLWKVELPLAATFILAGLRTATVLAVGIATIAAAVGAGGLGEFIFGGVASVDNRLVLAGAIPAALLAIAADSLLGWMESRLRTPAPGCRSSIAGWPVLRQLPPVGDCRLRPAPLRPSCDRRQELHRTGGARRTSGATYRSRTGMKVERRFYLAGSYIANQALIAGRIDVYVEYTGTALTAIFKQPIERDPQKVLDTVRRLYLQRYGVVVMPSLGFQNTFAMVVRGAQAKELGLTTLSQAARFTPNWKLGVGYEFDERPDGLKGLEQAYGLRFDGAPR